MAASRFRAPKTRRYPIRHQPAAGYGTASLLFHKKQTGHIPATLEEREPEPVLRRSRTGLCNLPAKQRRAIHKSAGRVRRPKTQESRDHHAAKRGRITKTEWGK